jgi:hypothetical protein
VMDIYTSPEMILALSAERELHIEQRRWNRTLREMARKSEPTNIRRWRGRRSAAKRRREIFASALDAAQREGITVDAWFSYKFADPELSARAEWAGLIDEASASAKDVWAA